MQLVVVVQVLQTHEQFAHDDGDVIFCNVTWSHKITTAAARTILHDDPQIGSLKVGAIVFRNIGRVEPRQDGYLLYNVVDFVFGVLYIDDFDGHGLTSALIDTEERKRSVAETFACTRFICDLPFVYFAETASS